VSGTALVVGGYGALGSAISAALETGGLRVLRSTRRPRPGDSAAVVLPANGLVPADLPLLDAVVWAQGINVNDAVDTYAEDDLAHVLDVNVVSVARQLNALLAADRIADDARLVVVSSVWEVVARPGKFSYTVAKAALGGLVRAAAMDLAPRGVLINAVLPGVVDTPMSRAMLDPAQISRFEQATGAGRMVSPQDVASLVEHLASARNTGVTGQSVSVDLGFTVGRIL
jgi:3-oxoacyl-[acyl-carrier protein] reductase